MLPQLKRSKAVYVARGRTRVSFCLCYDETYKIPLDDEVCCCSKLLNRWILRVYEWHDNVMSYCISMYHFTKVKILPCKSRKATLGHVSFHHLFSRCARRELRARLALVFTGRREVMTPFRVARTHTIIDVTFVPYLTLLLACDRHDELYS
jgi:3-polyprenyl-4-hydroxybenzoate decarboxylase